MSSLFNTIFEKIEKAKLEIILNRLFLQWPHAELLERTFDGTAVSQIFSLDGLVYCLCINRPNRSLFFLNYTFSLKVYYHKKEELFSSFRRAFDSKNQSCVKKDLVTAIDLVLRKNHSEWLLKKQNRPFLGWLTLLKDCLPNIKLVSSQLCPLNLHDDHIIFTHNNITYNAFFKLETTHLNENVLLIIKILNSFTLVLCVNGETNIKRQPVELSIGEDGFLKEKMIQLITVFILENENMLTGERQEEKSYQDILTRMNTSLFSWYKNVNKDDLTIKELTDGEFRLTLSFNFNLLTDSEQKIELLKQLDETYQALKN